MAQRTEADLERFGLNPPNTEGRSTAGGEPHDSLFAQEQRHTHGGDEPWWHRMFFLREPVLFGTWDGVFTSVMVNIFGVIVFLRMGWIVGTAGVANAILLLIICASLALIPVLSAIGICERCQIQSGGVYFLVSHVLGGQIGGAVGVLYCFGQAVATALVAVGFGESMAHFFGSESQFLIKLIAILVLIALTAINMAGVTWVIKLQLALLGFILLAVVDFLLGSLVASDKEHGVVGMSMANFRLNSNASYDGVDCSKFGGSATPSQESFFTVFGVFFANFLGVLAGVNMSGDLKNPSKNIPLGELAAVGTSSGFCFLFIMALGGVATREALLCDSMIAERASLTKIFFLAGLYISSLSSTLGGMYGTPRVMQSIAAEHIIPALAPLEVGRGPNKIPVVASLVMTAISLIFVLVGNLNQLAILSTMPFLITYAFVNYSYVSLAMTYDLITVNDLSRAAGLPASYGSMGNIKAHAGQGTSDLDNLFPERTAKPIKPEPGNPESEALNAQPHDGQQPIQNNQRLSIIGQPQSWYSLFCNRYVSLVGAIINIFIILLVNFWFAILHFLALAALYVYIGQVCPGVFSGITEFSIPHMIRTVFGKFREMRETDEVVVAPLHPGVDTFASRLTDDNTDYAGRKQYHQSRTEQLDEFD
uniref:Amino acid permease/ SLC12A domain-containing protein n=1 Tax=Plectus sambesii TaxID=2011161 RepID=A0A914XQC2_9BILA